MKPILKLQDASKIYRQGGVKTVGIEAVNLEIYPHDFVAITGRSGCGKSTLLNILGCMEKIGYVFQAFNLVNEISALENVCMPLGYAGVSKRERDAVAHELLARVGMAEKANKRPVNLSGGEQQRVAIARALARSPRVLLADEPTGNLDKANSLAIMELFSSFNRSGMTIVMVTHSPDVAAYASRQIHICDGKIIESFLGGTY